MSIELSESLEQNLKIWRPLYGIAPSFSLRLLAVLGDLKTSVTPHFLRFCNPTNGNHMGRGS
jgi:hypothetical protein